MSPATTDTAPGPAGPLRQGDPALLDTAAARRLLASTIPARFAYVALDGTPRVVPTWFHWTGHELVTVTYVAGPQIGIRHPANRLAALRRRPDVAVTIDTDGFPPESLSLRGPVEITEASGLAPEYVAAAHRYLGAEAAAGMVSQLDAPGTVQARVALRPTWVGLLDFTGRRPSAQGGVDQETRSA
ncbi:pyridoxamine 5'-phosphate oxidase family protein [Frankia sp. CNm7]|uniref:Pyridoxamine 5'-phosphate oxidase family protein n=1 Tax=Frankia nepalensis TaxID=1836974 RepID=A0A937UQZ4_9ACTN|nr:pyridoxamine 5'-phosphate oxidase family protein [Frankia nepalensis]MBL7498956.1 pyridoxamine 5'-phosphate oxidase family protein [Frankia nepalensis]MBL7511247.1 pyridoxamine 5'-phosphate oxidase family protein [Frankia nepalensis]MBL7520579.1 pyridoxamine 5'-phosphate oxidase family protein [Frankia nepalensis]MBL7630767.1 pyridoxamine 5'-phosphate oxidase family protein [Frankia nepalensis]